MRSRASLSACSGAGSQAFPRRRSRRPRRRPALARSAGRTFAVSLERRRALARRLAARRQRWRARPARRPPRPRAWRARNARNRLVEIGSCCGRGEWAWPLSELLAAGRHAAPNSRSMARGHGCVNAPKSGLIVSTSAWTGISSPSRPEPRSASSASRHSTSSRTAAPPRKSNRPRRTGCRFR